MTTEILALTPEAQKVAIQAARLLADAESLEITTAEQYNAAAQLLPSVKGLSERLNSERFSQTRPLDREKAAIMDLYRPLAETLMKAEGIVKRGLKAFADEQKRLQQEAQRKANEEARKERDRLEGLALKARQEANASELERVAARAEVRAEKYEDKAAAVVAPVVPVDLPKVAGIGTREQWKFEITDAALIPREYLIPDEKAIRQVVNALKERAAIAGVRTWREDGITSRSAS